MPPGPVVRNTRRAILGSSFADSARLAASSQRSSGPGCHSGRISISRGTPTVAHASAALPEIAAAKGCVASTRRSMRSAARCAARTGGAAKAADAHASRQVGPAGQAAGERGGHVEAIPKLRDGAARQLRGFAGAAENQQALLRAGVCSASVAHPSPAPPRARTRGSPPSPVQERGSTVASETPPLPLRERVGVRGIALSHRSRRGR